MRKQQLAPFTEKSFDVPFTSDCYAVINIGGGTVNIAVCQVSKIAGQQIKAFHPARNDCGSSRVNKEFRKFLGNLVDDIDFSKLVNTGNEDTNAVNEEFLSQLVNETFEKQKQIFQKKVGKTGKTGKIAIQLPFAFMQVYRAKLQRSIQQLNDPRVQLYEMTLYLAYTKVEEFFRPFVDGMVWCVSETLESIDVKIDTIYLVGDFGGSCYFYDTIKERLGTAYKYIVPMDPDFAVVRGAVLFHQKPHIVQARRADATYGIRASIPFIEGVHEEDYKWVDEDGETQCENIFSTIVERGDLLSADEVVVMKCKPTAAHQRRMHIDIFCSSERDVWYTTGRRPANSPISTPVEVTKIGELIISLRVGDKKRISDGDTKEKDLSENIIEVNFDFSHTEIHVKVFHPRTKTNMTAVLDFLSS